MKSILKVLTIMMGIFLSFNSFAQTQAIEFKGLKSNNQGIVLWHNLQNPAEKGYEIQPYFPQVPTSCIKWAYYYMASADYGDFNTSASSGASATGTITGFTNFQAALNRYGLTLANNFHYRFGRTDMNEKVQGTDYKIDAANSTETRYYQGGRFEFLVGNTVIASGEMPKMTAIIKYNSQRDCRDDELSGQSAYFRSITKSSGLSATLNEIADAFISDVTGTGKMMQFELNSIRPASAGVQDFGGNLQGGFFDIQSGKLKVVKINTSTIKPLKLAWTGRVIPQKGIKYDYSKMSIQVSNGKIKETVKLDKLGNFKTSLQSGKYNVVVFNGKTKVHSSTVIIKTDTKQNVFISPTLKKVLTPKNKINQN